MPLYGGPIAPSSYGNLIETDRYLLWTLSGKREGIVTGLYPTRNPAGMSMLISAGEAFIKGETAGSAGAYFAWNPAQETLTWPAAPATNSRIDALVLAVRDSQFGALPGGAVNGPLWLVVSGTAGTSPNAPNDAAITTAVGPGGWLRVANVTVAAGETTLTAASISRTAGTAFTLPYAKMSRAATQSIADVTDTTISYTVIEENNPPGFASTSTNTFTIPEDGLYEVLSQVRFSSSAQGSTRTTTIKLNGTTVARKSEAISQGVVGGSSFQVVYVGRLVTGNTLTMDVYHNAGAALTLDPTSGGGVWAVCRKLANPV